MHLSLRFVTKFMTASAVTVNAPARNEKENTSQAPALSEVQSSRCVGGSPAKESPARHVSRPPAWGSPVYKESSGAADGTGRRAGPRTGQPGDEEPLHWVGSRTPTTEAEPQAGEGVSRLLGMLGSAERPLGQRSTGKVWLRHGAASPWNLLNRLRRAPGPGAAGSPRLGPGLGCSPAELGSL